MVQRIALIGRGNTVSIAAATTDTGGLFALLDYELAPGFGSLPLHVHTYEDSAVYVLEGALQVQLGEGTHLVDQGGFILLPRGISHAMRNTGTLPARFLVLLLPAGFEQCCLDLEVQSERPEALSRDSVVQLLARYGVQPSWDWDERAT